MYVWNQKPVLYLSKKVIICETVQEADEFIIGLPKSCDGMETPQSNKVRSVAGRLAVRAAERHVCVVFICFSNNF